MDRYQAATAYADRIEHELRALNVWESEPPPASAYESEAAFFEDRMTFYQWLQFVLLPRVREIGAQRGRFPRESSVGEYAVRELDGRDADCALIEALSDFDDFIERKVKA
jgi:uncharacterized protein YqcC (DUF446 family)